MLGLRLVDGLAEEDADRLLRQHPSGMDERRAAAIERHRASGLLEVRDGRLRLTRRGRLLADTVLSDLV